MVGEAGGSQTCHYHRCRQPTSWLWVKWKSESEVKVKKWKWSEAHLGSLILMKLLHVIRVFTMLALLALRWLFFFFLRAHFWKFLSFRQRKISVRQRFLMAFFFSNPKENIKKNQKISKKANKSCRKLNNSSNSTASPTKPHRNHQLSNFLKPWVWQKIWILANKKSLASQQS